MDSKGLGRKHGRPLGKHHATTGQWEAPVGDGLDPGTTRDEGTYSLDPHLPGDPDWRALVADDAVKAIQRESRFGSPRPARWKVEWTASFLRGFFMSLGIVLGACAGVVISGVLVFLLLTAFGAGQ